MCKHFLLQIGASESKQTRELKCNNNRRFDEVKYLLSKRDAAAGIPLGSRVGEKSSLKPAAS